MAEHRVPMLGAALRRHVDPARSRDPQVRELVSALATLEVAPAPRADFRAELRAQLVAVTPRLVEEGKAELPATRKPVKVATPERQGLRFKKPLIAAVGVLATFVLLLGGGVLLSQNSLPGDALYGLKRASENTEYSLAGSSVDKGKLKLEFAARRIGEVGDLLASVGALAAGHGVIADGGTVSTHTAGLVRDTLHSADSDIKSAAQLLGDAAVRDNSAGPLDDLISWAPEQLDNMDSIVGRIPAGNAALQAQAVHTRQLIATTMQRAKALEANLGTTSTPSGPAKTGTPGRPGKSPVVPSKRGSSGASTPPSNPTSTTAGGRKTQTTPPASTSPGSSSSPNPISSPTPTKPPVSLPVKVPTSLPGGGKSHHSTPTPPVGVDSCGVYVSLGPLGLGGC
jgi:hypothetical protein